MCSFTVHKIFSRYKYHRSLLDWFVEGLPQDPIFNECCYNDCCIIIGGDICAQKMLNYFDENSSFEALHSTNLGSSTKQNIFYFINCNLLKFKILKKNLKDINY